MKVEIKCKRDIDVSYIRIDAGVRYWEDSDINNIEDTNCEETDGFPMMPFSEFIGDQNKVLRGENWRWRPVIDVETGQIIDWPEGTEASIHYKVCDDFSCDILDKEYNVIYHYDGYVPSIMCPIYDGYGDNIIMDVDNKGYIVGWKSNRIQELIEKCREDEQ